MVAMRKASIERPVAYGWRRWLRNDRGGSPSTTASPRLELLVSLTA
jgi:hypothetical protein